MRKKISSSYQAERAIQQSRRRERTILRATLAVGASGSLALGVAEADAAFAAPVVGAASVLSVGVLGERQRRGILASYAVSAIGDNPEALAHVRPYVRSRSQARNETAGVTAAAFSIDLGLSMGGILVNTTPLAAGLFGYFGVKVGRDIYTRGYEAFYRSGVDECDYRERIGFIRQIGAAANNRNFDYDISKVSPVQHNTVVITE
jgi:hypothetical protein